MSGTDAPVSVAAGASPLLWQHPLLQESLKLFGNISSQFYIKDSNMEKKNYVAPTVSYVGPDVPECLETNAPLAAAVGTSVITSVTTAVLKQIF